MTVLKQPGSRRFTQAVDKRSRQAMSDYLSRHFRYPTGNSWNQSTSYACNLKVTDLGLDSKTVDRLLALIAVPEFYDRFQPLFQQFAQSYQYRWQAGWNGRSGGYLVLYQGEIKPSGYRSYCTACGQRNYRSVTETGCTCGACGAKTRIDYMVPPMLVQTYPFRSTDQDEDFEDWDLWQLRERTELVQSFDRLADSIVAAGLEMAQAYTAVEEVYYAPHTRLVLKEACS